MALGSIAVSNRGQGNLVWVLATCEEAGLEWAFAYRIGHCSCQKGNWSETEDGRSQANMAH